MKEGWTYSDKELKVIKESIETYFLEEKRHIVKNNIGLEQFEENCIMLAEGTYKALNSFNETVKILNKNLALCESILIQIKKFEKTVKKKVKTEGKE